MKWKVKFWISRESRDIKSILINADNFQEAARRAPVALDLVGHYGAEILSVEWSEL